MDFEAVYGRLRTRFPGVDSRYLKAVATEHPGDEIAAADVVITEMLLSFGGIPTYWKGDTLVEVGSYSRVKSTGGEESNADDLTVSVIDVAGTGILSADACGPVQWPGSNEKHGLLCETPESEPDEPFPNAFIEHMIMNLLDEDETANTDSTEEPGVEESDFEFAVDGFTESVEENYMVQHTPGGLGNIIEHIGETVDAAINNKKILVSTKDSVMEMLRKVELAEQEAEQVKVAAAASKNRLNESVSLERLKEILAGSKEVNAKHAEEVHHEKAILMAEVKELEARLNRISDEKENSLAILNQMLKSLDARLGAANELINEGLEEKAESSEEVNILLDKVVEESHILLQEQEDNHKLRDSLLYFGSVVDDLVGEFSHVFEDVELLNEKYEEGVLLRKSMEERRSSGISCSTTASLSLKWIRSTPVAEVGKTSLVSSLAEPSSPDSRTGEEMVAVDDNSEKHLVDDWVLLDEEDMEN